MCHCGPEVLTGAVGAGEISAAATLARDRAAEFGGAAVPSAAPTWHPNPRRAGGTPNIETAHRAWHRLSHFGRASALWRRIDPTKGPLGPQRKSVA